jgi:penicillin-binding protein 1C
MTISILNHGGHGGDGGWFETSIGHLVRILVCAAKDQSRFCSVPSVSSVVKDLVFVFLTVVAQPAIAEVPSFADVKARWTPTEGELLDRNGVLVHELRVVDRGRRLPWTTLDEISPSALAVIVHAEDRRFYKHAGVDWLALPDAALDTLFRSRPRGASTISMQVAAQLDPALRAARGQRTVAQKWDQMQAARKLEQTWSKREILEAYLNLATFRGELVGIGAASRGLFGKLPGGLDERESLLLAALLRGPNAGAGTAAERACALGRERQPPSDCAGIETLALATLSRDAVLAPRASAAPHVARRLLSPEQPRVRSTLDAGLQAHANQILAQQLASLAGRHVTDGAVLVVSNATGEVLAYVGNAGNPEAWYVDGVQAPRQAGSTLKPFLYQMAIGQRLITAASLTDDSPVNLVTPAGLYVPQNYDRDFKGLVSVRGALSSSLNVPAVRTLMVVGADAFADRLRMLGFDEVQGDGDYYGYSLALGSAEVTLWQLANAYRTLANGGRTTPLVLLPGAPATPVQVSEPDAAYVVAGILADPLARSLGFGLENPLASRHWAAVKTGTSKDMRDNWCVGFTDRYTVAVWVGNFDGSPMRDVSGISGAAPVWLDLVNYLHRYAASKAPPVARGVMRSRVRFDADIEPPREELFLAGTVTPRVAAKPAAAVRAGIAYPGNGTIIALDPDIPHDVQRVRFLMAPEAEGFRWVLDGADAGSAGGSVFWSPRPGTHELALVDAAGKETDRVRFQVRGSLPARDPD